MRVTVYGLASSSDQHIRYIGQTVQEVGKRLRQHISESKRRRGLTGKSRRVWNWIASVLQTGHQVVIIILDKEAVLHTREIELIQEYRDKGFDLVNTTDGGEGTVGFRNHRKRPWVADMNRKRAGIKTKPLSEEHKQKVSVGNKGKKKPGLAERNRERARLFGGTPHTEESKSKISQALKGREITTEWREKLSIAAKRRYAKEEATHGS